MKFKIDEIRFVKELYPRFEADNATINQYRQSVSQLPPIILTKENVLVDGYHRLLAHKLEGLDEIEAEFIDCQDESGILIEAIKRNSSHGRQLSIREKKALTLKLWELGVKDLDEIGIILSIGLSTVQSHTQTLRQTEKEQRDAEILDLYLQCWTQREIAKKLEIDHKTVSNSLGKNPKLGEIPQPDDLQFYNVWSIMGLGKNQLQYPGQTPRDIIENLVYYYTEPPITSPSLKISRVVDPMAGSGIVGEVCRDLNRRYLLYDIDPLREDMPIKKNDILKGLPDESKNADLVYLDPPYYNLLDDYPDNAFTLSYESFLEAMRTVFINVGKILAKTGKVALDVMPMNERTLSGSWFDLTIDCAKIAIEEDYTIIKRISAPMTVQQYQAHHMVQAKENRFMLNLIRDITIFRRN